jgi:hypothetical protein
MILIHNKKNLFLAVLILLFAQNTISSPVKDPEQSLKDYTGAAQIPLSWEVGFHKEKAQTPFSLI